MKKELFLKKLMRGIGELFRRYARNALRFAIGTWRLEILPNC